MPFLKSLHLHVTIALLSNISQDFLDANEQAVSFFVKVYNPSPWLELVHNIQSDSVDNAKTQEKLVIKGVDTTM
jgi:hypothetical protein